MDSHNGILNVVGAGLELMAVAVGWLASSYGETARTWMSTYLPKALKLAGVAIGVLAAIAVTIGFILALLEPAYIYWPQDASWPRDAPRFVPIPAAVAIWLLAAGARWLSDLKAKELERILGAMVYIFGTGALLQFILAVRQL